MDSRASGGRNVRGAKVARRGLVVGCVLQLCALPAVFVFPGGSLQSQEPARQRSVLGAFLKRETNASVQRKDLLALTSSNGNKVTLTAVVARDPAEAAVKIKGIEVRLEEGERKGTVYIDDEEAEPPHGNLADFQERLSRLLERKRVLITRCKDGDRVACNEPGLTSPGYATTPAMNRGVASPDEHDLWYTVLNAGWYGSGTGVVINSGDLDIDVRIPGADLGALVRAIATARAFLDAN